MDYGEVKNFAAARRETNRKGCWAGLQGGAVGEGEVCGGWKPLEIVLEL